MLFIKVRGLEDGVKTELEDKSREVSGLHRELASTRAQAQQLLKEKTDSAAQFQTNLARLEREKEREREGERQREEDLKRSLEQSEAVRRSLLAQVERNGRELEKMTERLGSLQERESEAERARAEAGQLHHMVRETDSLCV